MNQDVSAPSVATPTGDRAKVFVSYSRKDSGFAQMLVGALAERGFDAFLDKTDIAPGEPWKERLAGLIATADTVVFTVSPDLVASAICSWELEESARLGKRIIPVVARRIADADAPPALGRLNWVFCAEGDDKDAALAALDTALHTDLAWVREHTRLGELARHWDEAGRSRGLPARRGPGGRRALARPPPRRRQRADRSASGLHPGEPAGCDGQTALLGRRLARRRHRRDRSGGFAEINRREAQTQRERAERTLTLATDTANRLVFDLAQKFRDVVGVPAATIKDILDRARQLRTSSWDRAKRARICAEARRSVDGDSQNTLGAR